MAEHTPTPWTLTPKPYASWIGKIGNNFDDPQLWSVATPYPRGDKHADAAFIVKAVNNHDALVKIAEAFRNADAQDWAHLFRFIPESGHGKFWKDVFMEIREALAR